jgi:hypothetical protein
MEVQLAKPESECLLQSSHILIFPSSKHGGDKYWKMEQIIAQVQNFCDVLIYLCWNSLPS